MVQTGDIGWTQLIGVAGWGKRVGENGSTNHAFSITTLISAQYPMSRKSNLTQQSHTILLGSKGQSEDCDDSI